MNSTAKKDISDQLRTLLLDFHNFGADLNESQVGVNQVARALGCSPSSVSQAFKKLGFEDHAAYVRICGNDELLSTRLQMLAGEVCGSLVRSGIVKVG